MVSACNIGLSKGSDLSSHPCLFEVSLIAKETSSCSHIYSFTLPSWNPWVFLVCILRGTSCLLSKKQFKLQQVSRTDPKVIWRVWCSLQLPRHTEWFNMSLNNLWSGVVRLPCKWKATASLVAAIQRWHRLNHLVLFAQNPQNSFSAFALGLVCILLEKALLDTARKFPYSFLTRMLQQRHFSGTGRDLPAPLQVTLQKCNEPKEIKWE